MVSTGVLRKRNEIQELGAGRLGRLKSQTQASSLLSHLPCGPMSVLATCLSSRHSIFVYEAHSTKQKSASVLGCLPLGSISRTSKVERRKEAMSTTHKCKESESLATG